MLWPLLMTQLSVNVNKIATLRNARGKNLPDVTTVARDILTFGADGITVHPRPDERHIRRTDVFALKELIQTYRTQTGVHVELNVEGYPSDPFLEMILQIRPDQCTLVPDPPEVLTSNAGWNLAKSFELIEPIIQKLTSHEIRSSVFIDPFDFNSEDQSALQELHPHRIELYTEAYAESWGRDGEKKTIGKYLEVAKIADQLNIGVNAGHDLNLQNLKNLIQSLPMIKEVSIGHALICESLYLGLELTVLKYQNILRGPCGSRSDTCS